MRQRRVVITGMGVVSPSGNSLEELWGNLTQGKSAAGLIDTFDTSAFHAKIGCLVRNFDPSNFLNPKEVKHMDRVSQFAVAASKMALKDADLEVEKDDPERIGTIVGSGSGGMKSILDAYKTLLEKGPSRVSPLCIPMFILNMASAEVSIQTGAKGPNFCVVTACASAAHSIGEAARLIMYGDADVMITGGSEATITDLSLACFCSLRALSTRNDFPQKASRPFDKDRDGFVMGEGAGIVILEELEHARRRGARIHAEFSGYGLSSDAYHKTAPAPDDEGAVRCIKMALKDAEVNPEEVDYINAHGTSTVLNDKSETQAIKKVFGYHAKKVPVSSTKSMMGHLIGAAGGVELVICALAMKFGSVPPTINYETTDPECDLDYVPNYAREVKVDVALSNSFGFGGHNAALVLKRFV